MKVLCIGHATYDISVPVDSFPVENQKYYLKEKIEGSGGGACNAAYLLGKWKAESYFSGVVGYDDFGTFVKKEMEKMGIRLEFMEVSYEKKTSTSFILINKSNHTRTIFNIEPEEFHLKKYEYDITPDVIFMDGYEYGASNTATNKYPNAITILDAAVASKEIMALGRNVKYIVCSLEFVEQVSGLKADFNNPVTLLTIYKKVKDRFPNNEIVITLKGHGALYCVNNEVKVMPTISVQEIDRTGAGDIFRGAFAYALGKNYDLEKSVRIANIAAGLSTTKYGAKSSIPLLSEVVTIYEQKFGPLEIAPITEENSPENQNSNPIPIQNEQPNNIPPVNEIK